MPKLMVRDLFVAFDDTGQEARGGAGTLLLVHGHPFDRSMWHPQIAPIVAAGWRVIAPDLRGYGATGITTGKVTLDVFADDLAALLDALGVGPAVVGGLSMGGQIAMEFAHRHAGDLRGLVLAATFPRIDSDDVRRHRLTTADRMEQEGTAAFVEELLPKMLAPVTLDTMPSVVKHVRSMMRSTPPAGAAAALRGRAERPPYEPVLAEVAVPTLVIAGDADAFTTRADVDTMCSLLRDVRIVRMDGVGHMPNLERPDVFNDALLAFLATV
jgi:3-oxoadipate enol-lactonase